MSNTYGFVKCKVVTDPTLKKSRHKYELQYHLHATLSVAAADGSTENWDTAINVGTNDSDDLLQYKLIFDFQHPAIAQFKAAAGFSDLTGTAQLPALDFLRSDLLKGTGDWRTSDIMDGSTAVEPVASLLRLLRRAQAENLDVYVFGRTYKMGGPGIHDVHMNQGSTGSFLNDGQSDDNDHNDVWQDGAVLVDVGEPEFAAYFTAFTQQMVPTDDLGNPVDGSHEITVADDGTLQGE